MTLHGIATGLLAHLFLIHPLLDNAFSVTVHFLIYQIIILGHIGLTICSAQIGGHPLLNPFPTILHEPIQNIDTDLTLYLRQWIQYLMT